MKKKKKRYKTTSGKTLSMPSFVAYFIAGVGICFAVLLLVLIFKSFSSKTKVDEKEVEKWSKVATTFKEDGLLLEFSKTNDDEGVAVVDEEKWRKLPYDSKEAMCIAVSKSINIKTLLVASRDHKHLGTYRLNGALFEAGK